MSRHTWRTFLWTIAALAAGIAAIAIIWTPKDKITQTVTDKRVDWVGAALVTVGMILMMFAISDGETAPRGWGTGCMFDSWPIHRGVPGVVDSCQGCHT